MFLEFITLMHQLRSPKGGTSRWVKWIQMGCCGWPKKLGRSNRQSVVSLKDKSLYEGICKLGRKMMLQYYYNIISTQHVSAHFGDLTVRHLSAVSPQRCC